MSLLTIPLRKDATREMNRLIIQANLSDRAFRGKGNKAIRRAGGKPLDLPLHGRGMNREEFWAWMREGEAHRPKRSRNVRRKGVLVKKWPPAGEVVILPPLDYPGARKVSFCGVVSGQGRFVKVSDGSTTIVTKRRLCNKL